MNTARRAPPAALENATFLERRYGAQADLPPASILGRVLANRYLPDALISQGALSVRYRADDLAIDETVCVEFLPRRAIGSWSQIRRAVSKLAALGDRHIVEVVGRGMASGAWPFLVTQDGKAQTLRDALTATGPFELARVARLGAQCARALAAAHGVGVLHAALGPDRIISSGVAADETVKVSGFGLASLVEAGPNALLSSSPELYHYSSPEQITGQQLDQRSDVYSLGAVLYELAAGQPPFTGSASSVLRQHLGNQPEPASRRRGSREVAFRAFDNIIGRCLAKLPEQRYSSAAELAADLGRLDAALSRAHAVAGSSRPQNDTRPTNRVSLAAPERRSSVELRPAHRPPPKYDAGARQLPKVIVQSA
jgi:serine/threonine-protein kinase